ncbi:MAG: threonine/serine dehydratase [Dongiaceae bacterium]
MTSSAVSEPLPTAADIEAAAARLAGHAVLTPLLSSPALDARTGGRILLKPEIFQRNGSFKFRGAYNKVAQLAAGGTRAVIAFSSGNHAQGVADAARLCGLAATIIMPRDAPAIKIENTRALGAEIVLYERRGEDREAIAERLIAERGAALVRPYDDPAVIAGQGTVGRELAAQAAALGAVPETVLVPCGGGGLTAGIALALEAALPAARVRPVEPTGFDDTTRSLVAGERLGNAAEATSFCDALMAAMPGRLTFPINHRLVGPGLTVTDAEVTAALAYAFRVLKLVIEPGGAVGLAALLAGKLDARGRTVAVVLSGGNVDPATYAAAIT